MVAYRPEAVIQRLVKGRDNIRVPLECFVMHQQSQGRLKEDLLLTI